MAIDSSEKGSLLPLPNPAPQVLEDDGLHDFFQEWLVSLTGLPQSLIRPRWQPETPTIPESNVTWIAFGIKLKNPDTFSAEVHYSGQTGYNELRRHEEISILISSYGPSCGSLMSALSDNMQISQNREILSDNSMGLVSATEPFPVPELVKGIWYKREDMTVVIKRQKRRHYRIQSIVEADGILHIENRVDQITVRSDS